MRPSVSDYLFSVRKRLLDVFIAIIGLVVLMIIFPFIFLLVKLSSPGPVFYKRDRLGKDGNTFAMIKFRTMLVNSDRDLISLRTQKDDPRVTSVGNFLRGFYLDEFPQFWNVLKGDMSIVGPRPEFPELEKSLEDREPMFKFRLLVKPGVTGYTQVVYPHAHDDVAAMKRIEYDIHYIKMAGFLMDLRLIFKTLLKVVILRKL